MIRLFAAAAVLATCVIACESDPFSGASDTVGASVVPGDTTMLQGDAALFTGYAHYGVCPECNGLPQTISWTVTNTDVATLADNPDNTAQVTAVAVGTTFIVAFVNQSFRDSTLLTVVAP